MNPSSPSRRNFLADGLRSCVVLGAGGFVFSQAVKHQRLANDPNCIRLNTCADCVEYGGGCQLPKAEAFRSEQNA